MTGYTKDHWRVIHFDGDVIVQRGDSGGFVIKDKDRERATADAHLIAAAPEMVEALKNAVAQLERMGSDGLSSGAIAAIAKAEGRA